MQSLCKRHDVLVFDNSDINSCRSLHTHQNTTAWSNMHV